jgi:hypothetical protein
MSKITGHGFGREEFSDDERAQHREMFHEYNEQRPVSKPFFNALGAAKSMAYTAGIMGVLGGAVAWMVKAGWFQ